MFFIAQMEKKKYFYVVVKKWVLWFVSSNKVINFSFT